jgi:hypothetical protein
MKIRVLVIFAFLSFASGAVAGILPADGLPEGGAPGGKGVGIPSLLLAQDAQSPPSPGTSPAGEAATPSAEE